MRDVYQGLIALYSERREAWADDPSVRKMFSDAVEALQAALEVHDRRLAEHLPPCHTVETVATRFDRDN